MAKAFKYKVNDRVETINGQWGTITKLESKGTFPYLITWDESGRTERYKEKNFDDWKWKVHPEPESEVEVTQPVLDFSRESYQWSPGDRCKTLPSCDWQPGELVIIDASDPENIVVELPALPGRPAVLASKFLQPCLPLPSVTTAQVSAQVMPLPDCSLDSSLLAYASVTSGAEKSSVSDIQAFPSSQISTNWTAHKSQSKSSRSRLHVNRSAFKAKGKEPQIKETVSLELFEQSNKASQAFSPLKTSPDYLAALLNPDSRQVRTLRFSGEPSTKSGSMLNGFVSAQPTLEPPSLESDYLLLASPSAMSTFGETRPPGSDNLTDDLKNKGLISSTEVADPEFLEKSFKIPKNWTSPLELRAATELLEEEGKPLEIASTLELPPLPSEESSISTASSFSDSGLAISFGKVDPELLNSKSVTRRNWVDSYAQKFIRAYRKGKRVKALDKGFQYGGKQIGWLTLLEEPYEQKLSDMPDTDLAAEGFPNLSKAEFINQFFEGKPETVVWVVRFKFEPLEVERSPNNPPDPLEKLGSHADLEESTLASDPLEKSEPSTDRESRQCGSLYEYLKNVANSEGVIVTYPKWEGIGERPKPEQYIRNDEVDKLWYWGISYEGKANGKRESKSKPISQSMLNVARELITAKCPVEITLALCQLKPIWMERKGEGNWLVGETKPSKCPRFFVFSFEERELFVTGPTWGESTPSYRQQKRKELTKALTEKLSFSCIKDLFK
jgi:hypothetical protein